MEEKVQALHILFPLFDYDNGGIDESSSDECPGGSFFYVRITAHDTLA